jgi:hypothetical protein
MAVKFLQPAQVGTIYNVGEIASFSAEIEKDLIDREIAEAVKAKGKATKAEGAGEGDGGGTPQQ